MPLAPELSIGITVVLCFVLSGLAYARQVLTLDGAVAAFGVGLLIGAFGDVTWLFLMLFFLVSSFAATRYRFALKTAMGVQEGARGERGASNVLANGFAPAVVSILGFSGFQLLPKEASGIVFVSALAVAGADTLASEIGVLSGRVYLITNFRKVKAGTDGGISLLGQGAAITASVYSALFGYLILVPFSFWAGLAPPLTFPSDPKYLIIPAGIGFLGCQVDSLLGATLERRGYLDKRTNNLVSTSLGAVLAFAIFEAIT